VITTAVDGRDFGTTASAVSSLSMEPPILLVCLSRTRETRAAVAEAGWFDVNILAQDQADIAGAREQPRWSVAVTTSLNRWIGWCA
jgi:flavin reductase (DIM6/NTAB) family NADH-FMN oxidoreductase RutF